MARTVSVALLGLVAACALPAPNSPSPIYRVERPAISPAPPVHVSFWRPVEFKLETSLPPPELPLLPEAIANLEEVFAREELSESERAELLRVGFIQRPTRSRPTTFGAFYSDLLSRSRPAFYDLAFLAEIQHLAWVAALREVRARVLSPNLRELTGRVRRRLERESMLASSDMRAAFGLAGDWLRVLESLILPGASLGGRAAHERRLLEVHVGVRPSPIFELPLDYSMFAPRDGSEQVEAVTADAWAELPFVVGAGDDARMNRRVLHDHLRAILLIARGLEERTDPEAHRAFQRIEKMHAFLFGPREDVGPLELLQLAKQEGLDASRLSDLEDVTRLDKVSAALFRRRVPHLFDQVTGYLPQGRRVEPAEFRVARVFGGSYARDSDALERHALFGLTLSSTEKDAELRSPRGTDVLAWYGNPWAIGLRERDFGTQKDAYGAHLERLLGLTLAPQSPARHESIYASLLDIVETAHKSSVADESIAATVTDRWQEHALEAAVGMWSTIRHDATQASAELLRPLQPTAAPPSESLVFVEPHPEGIARLVAVSRQLEQGLAAMDALPVGSAGAEIVGRCRGLLELAFRAALAGANDVPSTVRERDELRRLPDMVDDIERATGSFPARVSAVHLDLRRGVAVEVATGHPEELIVVVRESETHRLLLAMGAATPVSEWEVPIHARLTDTEWRALRGDARPARLLRR